MHMGFSQNEGRHTCQSLSLHTIIDMLALKKKMIPKLHYFILSHITIIYIQIVGSMYVCIKHQIKLFGLIVLLVLLFYCSSDFDPHILKYAIFVHLCINII